MPSIKQNKLCPCWLAQCKDWLLLRIRNVTGMKEPNVIKLCRIVVFKEQADTLSQQGHGVAAVCAVS